MVSNQMPSPEESFWKGVIEMQKMEIEVEDLKYLPERCHDMAISQWKKMEPKDWTLESLLAIEQIKLAEALEYEQEIKDSDPNCLDYEIWEDLMHAGSLVECLEPWVRQLEFSVKRKEQLKRQGGL